MLTSNDKPKTLFTLCGESFTLLDILGALLCAVFFIMMFIISAYVETKLQ